MPLGRIDLATFFPRRQCKRPQKQEQNDKKSSQTPTTNRSTYRFPYQTFVGRTRLATSSSSSQQQSFFWRRGADGAFIITDSTIAKRLLSYLDQCDYNYSDDEGGKQHACPLKGRKPPKKHSKLLSYSLTNANGFEWKRQRYFLSRALNGSVRQRIRENACHAAQQETKKLVTATDKSDNNNAVILDARSMSLKVASVAIGSALGGKAVGEDCTVLAQELFDATLKARRGGGLHDHVWDRMKFIVDKVSLADDNDDDDDDDDASFLKQLLCHEKKDLGKQCNHKYTQQKQGGLKREEIISNAFSILMAGTQTTSVTLACTLLHLAHRFDIQEALMKKYNNDFKNSCHETKTCQEEKDKGVVGGDDASLFLDQMTIEDAVMETLRVHPPVGALPRIVLKDDGVTILQRWNDDQNERNTKILNDDNVCEEDESDDDGNESTEFDGDNNSNPRKEKANHRREQRIFLPKGSIVEVDLVGCAHGGVNDKNDSGESSWKWDPLRRYRSTSKLHHDNGKRNYPPQKRKQSRSIPWGVGPRQCPAGSLSVAIVSSAISSLLQSGVQWDCIRMKSGQNEIAKRHINMKSDSYCYTNDDGRINKQHSAVNNTDVRKKRGTDGDGNWVRCLRYGQTLELPDEIPRLRFWVL